MAKNRFWKQLIGNLFGDSNIFGKFSDWVSNHAESWINSQTGAELTGAEREANAFTAEQAAISRDWQESMRATNFQAQVQDMKQAGLNPALMYANGGSSSTPSGASATSVAPNSPSSLSELLQAFKIKQEIAKLKAETSNIDSQTEVNKATAPKIEAETDFVNLQKEYYPKLTDAQINEINEHAKQLVDLATSNRASATASYASAKESLASADFINAQKIIKHKEAEWYDILHEAELQLKWSEEDRNTQEAVLAEIKKVAEQFRLDYMKEHGTEVPSGAWASLFSYFSNALSSTILDTEWWKHMISEIIGGDHEMPDPYKSQYAPPRKGHLEYKKVPGKEVGKWIFVPD